jgi:hypothetical protein
MVKDWISDMSAADFSNFGRKAEIRRFFRPYWNGYKTDIRGIRRKFSLCVMLLNLDITILSHVTSSCLGNSDWILILKYHHAFHGGIFFRILRNLWCLPGVISSHSAPLLYRDLNAKYGNNFLCVRTTFSLCGMEARKEARKQSRRRKLERERERENERMKKWRNEVVLMEKMHPVPAGLIYGNWEKGIEAR